MKLDIQKSELYSCFHNVFASADPSAFDFARLSLTLEVRVAVRPQCPAHSSTEPMLGFTISFNLHLIFNNQGLRLVSQFYPCWHPVLWSLPSPYSFRLTFPYFLPILQLPPLAAVVVGNWEEVRTLLRLRAQASTGNTAASVMHCGSKPGTQLSF